MSRSAGSNEKYTRRELLSRAGRHAAAGSLGLSLLMSAGRRSLAQARGPLVVADPGGPQTVAFDIAFHRPFQQATGIQTLQVAREHDPIAQVKLMVETGNYMWDVVMLADNAAVILGEAGYLEPIDYSQPEFQGQEFMTNAKRPYWIAAYAWSYVIGYRTDRYRNRVPETWADFWDVQRFPGRRSLIRRPNFGGLDAALLADGVKPEELYPLDVDRAFRSLDRIKDYVQVWWTGGAQSTQLIQSGEVDMIGTWNARIQAAIDDGAPVGMATGQGVYALDGWAIPKGNPKAELAQRFIAFASQAERNAAWVPYLAYGPANLGAYDYIDPQRARALVTTPDNLHNLAYIDPVWWEENQEWVTERFNAWLLS